MRSIGIYLEIHDPKNNKVADLKHYLDQNRSILLLEIFQSISS